MLPSLDQVLDWAIRYGSSMCGLLAFAALFTMNSLRKKETELIDLFVVGFAGSAVPTGCLLIYGAFDGTVVQRLADAGVYIGFAGLAILFIFYKTFREKLSSQ